MEDHCLQAMKIMDHYVNSCFDWVISGNQSVNPLREVISILSGKYKRFTFVHPMYITKKEKMFSGKIVSLVYFLLSLL